MANQLDHHHQQQQQQRLEDRTRQAREMLQLANSVVIASNHAHEFSIHQALRVRDLELAETVLYKACCNIGQWHCDWEAAQGDRIHRQSPHLPHGGHDLHSTTMAGMPSRSGSDGANCIPSQAPMSMSAAQQQPPPQNPFRIYLAQVRHRLAQTSLLLGKLNVACNLFLHVIVHDPDSLSLAALAMTWYDVALIYLHHRKWDQCQMALHQAAATVQAKPRDDATHVIPIGPQRGAAMAPLPSNHDAVAQIGLMRVGPDETMLFFIHQIIVRLRFVLTPQHMRSPNAPAFPTLPWSIQFTTVTCHFGRLTDAVAMPLSTVLSIGQPLPPATPHHEQQQQQQQQQQQANSTAQAPDESVQMPANGNQRNYSVDLPLSPATQDDSTMYASVTATNIPGILLTSNSPPTNGTAALPQSSTSLPNDDTLRRAQKASMDASRRAAGAA
eukprot:CAMPEP_0119547862 /NCGR_PEP_ID=MMETSP1352-20130426/1894_1 /TAXON_ID=265584 /ORGANISM="Stauroneis constricta, Strain CCMP1120" /LENGTH=441 /DNA_ID=CAMNT_0007592923 /DNA_START=307 /DNA_END=1632 /DNA_ORIENTATION=+